jgi:hypothetical protein
MVMHILDDSFDEARIAADLAFQNLVRLGRSCESARRRYKELGQERDLAIRGVARWGFSHRQLAEAACVTPQRVGQVLQSQPRVRITELQAQGTTVAPPTETGSEASRPDSRGSDEPGGVEPDGSTTPAM